MNLFNAVDVFHFAIRIEEDGELFYRRASLMVEEKEVSHLFNRLADEEIRHKAIFQNMLSQIGDKRPPESYPGEYLAYLRDYIDNKVVFTKEVKEKQLVQVHDTLSAIDFALQRELDSILYYHETKQFVSDKHHTFIDKIIDEERKHVTILSTIRKKYG